MADFSTWTRENLEALATDLAANNKVLLVEWRDGVKQHNRAVAWDILRTRAATAAVPITGLQLLAVMDSILEKLQ